MTTMFPLQNAPAFDARYKTVPAMSSSLPKRPKGTKSLDTLPGSDFPFIMPSVISDGKTARRQYFAILICGFRIYLQPGQKALTLTPCGASIVDKAFDMLAAAALLLTYAKPVKTYRMKLATLAVTMI